MSEREKLIKLLDDGCFEACKKKNDDIKLVRYLADHLLANGVIVPPVSVGDTVYVIYSNNIKAHPQMEILEETTVTEVSTQRIWVDGNYFDYDDIGKTVFLTREDAEKALAERKIEL